MSLNYLELANYYTQISLQLRKVKSLLLTESDDIKKNIGWLVLQVL